MTNNKRVGWSAFPKALGTALQWRVMLIWIVLMAIPTAIVALPVSAALGAMLDHSVHSAALAQQFHGLLMIDALMSISKHSGAVLNGAQTVGLIATLALSPFLTGVVVTAVHESRRPTLGELMHGGLAQYWRMFRLMLWSLVPYGIALIVGSIALSMAQSHASQAVLQSSADQGHLIAEVILIVLLVLAHCIMEASRAQVATDGGLRSATRAFGRGIALLVHRPLATLGLYLATSIVGYALAGLVGIWRIHTDAVGLFGFIGALLLAQLIVAILAWQRTARISALAMVARATPFHGRSQHQSEVALAPA